MKCFFQHRALIMENKILLFLFILIEAVILAFCEKNSLNSFASRFNDNTDAGNLDAPNLKDFYLFDSNTLVPEGKNVAKKQTAFNERYSQSADAVNSLEISQDISKTNFSEKQNEIMEFHQDDYNNWQREKINPFYPNRQESIQGTLMGQTFNRRINPQANNERGRSGNFFDNSQPRWNKEENYKQYQTARNGGNFDRATVTVPNMGKPVMNPDIRFANGLEKPFVNNRVINEYFPPKNEENEKVSLTLLNDEMKSINKYDYEVFQNRFKNQLNSKIDYNRHTDGFRTPNYHNPEKGVIINFNTECATTKPYTNPVFHKFIFTAKPQNPQVEVPTYHIPETSLYTRQMSTPICYL